MGWTWAFPSTRLHPKRPPPGASCPRKAASDPAPAGAFQPGPYLHSSSSPLVLFAPAGPFYHRLKADNIWGYSRRERWLTLTHVYVVFVSTRTHTWTFSQFRVKSGWSVIGSVHCLWQCSEVKIFPLVLFFICQ